MAGKQFAWSLVAALAVVSVTPATFGEEQGGAWPQFGGAGLDSVSAETGLLKQWPKGGPKLLWKFAECGRGYAGVSVVDGRLFTSGDFGREEFVLALDLDANTGLHVYGKAEARPGRKMGHVNRIKPMA